MAVRAAREYPLCLTGTVSANLQKFSTMYVEGGLGFDIPSKSSQFTHASAAAGKSEASERLAESMRSTENDAADTEEYGAKESDVAFACCSQNGAILVNR